jgi:hypothetical protein
MKTINRTERKEQLSDLAQVWYSWLCSYTPEASTWLLRMVASMPGGEAMEDLLGETVEERDWKRWELIEDLLNLAQDPEDVRFFCEELIRIFNEEMGEVTPGQNS